MDIFAAIDLKRSRVIYAVEVSIRLQAVPHAIDLPAFNLRLKIFAQHLQPADQLIADFDIRDLKRAIAEGDAWHQFFRGACPDELGALFRQRPEFAGVVKADPFDQFAEWQAEPRHHRTELVPRSVPADMPPFQYSDAGSPPSGFKRDSQAGQAGAHHANIDVEVKGQPRAFTQHSGI